MASQQDNIMSAYLHRLQSYLDRYFDRWVCHANRRDRIGPGMVIHVDMSINQAICKVRWADNKETFEFGTELEILS